MDDEDEEGDEEQSIHGHEDNVYEMDSDADNDDDAEDEDRTDGVEINIAKVNQT